MPRQSQEVRDCFVADASRNDKQGFTLLETIIACSIMVMAFAILAVIFGRAYTISKTIKRGSKNQRWGAYLMNTILYGPGAKTSTEGLIAATKICYSDDSGGDYPFTAASSHDNAYPNPSRFLCFYSPNGPIIYELVTIDSLYRNKVVSYLPTYDSSADPPTGNYFDLKPTYAKEGKLKLVSETDPSSANSSGFYFYKENNERANNTSEIKRVGIKLVIKNAFQELNQAIVLYQNVRIRNLYSSELE